MGRRSRTRKPSTTLPKGPDPSSSGKPSTTLEGPAPSTNLGGYYARSRARDEEARRGLEPLARGERPTAVTVAAIVAFAMAVANLAAALAGETLGSNAVSYTILATGILLACAGGMWFGARHWAVLGFMMVLVFQILSLSFALIRVERWWYGLLVALAIGLLGWLFYRLIRALARIQMPDRPGGSAPDVPR